MNSLEQDVKEQKETLASLQKTLVDMDKQLVCMYVYVRMCMYVCCVCVCV